MYFTQLKVSNWAVWRLVSQKPSFAFILTIDPYHSMSKQEILPVEPLIQCEAGRAKTIQRQSLYSPRTPKLPPSDKGEFPFKQGHSKNHQSIINNRISGSKIRKSLFVLKYGSTVIMHQLISKVCEWDVGILNEFAFCQTGLSLIKAFPLSRLKELVRSLFAKAERLSRLTASIRM